jgi:hypothetical protein
MKNKITYKEGQIMLNDGVTIFYFKSCRQNILDGTIFEIIDVYDNLIKIPYRNVLYIFYHANNVRNEGAKF